MKGSSRRFRCFNVIRKISGFFFYLPTESSLSGGGTTTAGSMCISALCVQSKNTKETEKKGIRLGSVLAE